MADFLVTLFFFASMEVVSKPLMAVVEPVTLTFWRFLAGAAVLAAILLRRRGPSTLRALSRRTLITLAVMGVVNITVAMTLLQTAVKLTSAGVAATVFCANPVLVFGISAAAGMERPVPRQVAGLLAGLAGLALVSGLHRLSVDRGTALAVVSAAAFAVFTVLGRKVSRSTDPFTVNAVSFTAGVAVLAPVMALTGVSFSPAPLLAGPGPVISTLYLSVGVSGLAYLTFIRAVRRMGALAASMVFMLKPAVASLLAAGFLGERQPPAFWAGLVLTAAGSFLVMGRAR